MKDAVKDVIKGTRGYHVVLIIAVCFLLPSITEHRLIFLVDSFITLVSTHISCILVIDKDIAVRRKILYTALIVLVSLLLLLALYGLGIELIISLAFQCFFILLSIFKPKIDAALLR